MRRLILSRAVAVLAAMCLMTGVLMMFASAASAQTPSSSPSPTASATPSPSSSSGGSGLPGPVAGLVPGSSASPSPSATAPETNPGGNTDVLGQTIPKTGADRALPLLIAGVILAVTSVAVRRVVTRRG